MTDTATATATITEHTTLAIPLDKLFVSPDNVRTASTPEGIAELAASIKAHGLQHNLVVRKNGKGYGIIDGSRRYQALQQLVKAGHISENLPVPCKLDESRLDAKELSLAANVVREDMHPADSYEAYRQLVDAGQSVAEIAAKFGVDEAYVNKLLKLARVSPEILKAYRDEELKLDEVMAFTLTDDHARQEQLLADLPTPANAQSIRRALTQDKLPVTDKRVKFVTLKAYEKAGGEMLQDLFVDFGNGGYVTNIGLLEELAKGKLDKAAEKLAGDGWKWVEVLIDFSYSIQHERQLQQIYPTQPELTKAEEKNLAKLNAKYDKLSDEWDGDISKDLPDGMAELKEEIRAIEDRDGVWTDEQKAGAGVIVTIADDGKVKIVEGVVKPEDMPARKAKPKQAEKSSADTAEPEEKGLSAALIENLSAQKSAALADDLMQNPEQALSELAYTLLLDVYQVKDASSCIQITCRPQSLFRVSGSEAERRIEETRKAWGKKIPKDGEKIRAWVSKQDRKTLLQILAFCAGLSVNAVQGKMDAGSTRLDHANQLAKDIELDVSAYFTPTAENYFSRVSSQQILADIAEARGKPNAPALEKLKKGDLAKEAEKLVSGTGWLPKPLRVS